MNKKTILLAISINHGISKLIESNLKYYGFNVILLSPHDELDQGFKYPSIWDNIKVKFNRIVLNNKQAKLNLQSEILKKNLDKKIGDKKIDYSLFFLAQNYSIDLITYVKNKTKKGGMINYQWDGIDRYPLIHERIPLFDKVYVFDQDDIKKYDINLLPTTSFYFDNRLENLPCEYDFYFLGSHIDNRAEKIINFAKYMLKKEYNLNFKIIGNNSKELSKLYPKNVNILERKEIKTYEENLQAAKKSKVLVDFVDSIHKGLSLRTFEALGYDKKLITTNKEIAKYDFYHTNNIFILDNNFDDIPEFLDKPYHYIEPKIKEKYSFGNWIKYVLDIQPYQPILLPME